MDTVYLELVADKTVIRSAFERWIECLTSTADEHEWGWFLPEDRLSFRYLDANPPRMRVEFSSPDHDKAAIVQISEPLDPTLLTNLSGVGRDSTGGLYLLRQGELHSNPLSGHIRSEFQQRTGLRPVPVQTDRASPREWYLVAKLNDNNRTIRATTTAFVDQCMAARVGGAQAAEDQARLDELLGNEETGGTFWVTPDPSSYEVSRTQGYVWQALRRACSPRGIKVKKSRHARGYEVDAEILAPTGPILVEIKTSSSPAAVYTGLGQLILYPKLLPSLSGHRRVLLLPAKPKDALMAALADTGIAVHTYALVGEGKDTSATFDAPFLALCGATGN